LAEVAIAVKERADDRLAECFTPDTRDEGMMRNFRRAMNDGEARFWEGMDQVAGGQLAHGERSGDRFEGPHQTAGGMRVLQMKKGEGGWRIVRLR
jgi:hypothetical protein